MVSKDRLKLLLCRLSYEQKEVTLASGRKSNFYFDGRQTALNPEGAYLIGECFLEKILSTHPEVQAVGGPTLGADPLVTAVSLAAFAKNKNFPAFIIRKEPKKHGLGAWIEGMKNLQPGMKVAVLEDFVTTGESSIKAAKRAEEEGLKVVGIYALVDREEGGAETIAQAGFSFYSLFTRTGLVG